MQGLKGLLRMNSGGLLTYDITHYSICFRSFESTYAKTNEMPSNLYCGESGRKKKMVFLSRLRSNYTFLGCSVKRIIRHINRAERAKFFTSARSLLLSRERTYTSAEFAAAKGELIINFVHFFLQSCAYVSCVNIFRHGHTLLERSNHSRSRMTEHVSRVNYC